MARPRAKPDRGALAGSIFGALLLSAAAFAAPTPAVDPPGADLPSPYANECQGNTAIESESPLPHVATALEQRKSVRILAIGASSARGSARGSYTTQIEHLLKRLVKGIEIVMINRGVSGELAANAATRIRTEVALNSPDLVLWQVGTNDALAYIPLEEVEQSVVDTLRWLKEHKVDVVLAGLQYVDRKAQSPHYDGVREMMRRIAAQEKVIIVRRYEAMQLIVQAEAPGGAFGPDEFERTEAGYRCLAEYFARAITLGIFGKGLQDIGPLRPPAPTR